MDGLRSQGEDHLMIYCAAPIKQYHLRKKEIDAAINRVLAGGRYILGDEVSSFEKEFAFSRNPSFG